jgi:Fe-S oxidoreductase
VKEIQPGRIIQAMRAKLVADGKGPPPEFAGFMERLKEHQNPYGQPDSKRSQWLKDLYRYEPPAADEEVTYDGKKTETVLYVGCSPLRDAAAEAMPKSAVKLLMNAGVDVGLLESQERCCGNPALRIGDQDEFVAFARENIKMFHSLGVEKLVCICPFCYSTFRRDYPLVGDKMNFEVVHILEFIAQLIESKKLKPAKTRDLSVTYHDPCHLGRISNDGVSGTGAFTGLYDVPRYILESIPGIEFVEMERIKDDALCCGAGSWMKMAYPDFAQATALERIAEAGATGTEAIVTYCPHCEENFDEALRSNGKTMEVYDLLDLLLESL